MKASLAISCGPCREMRIAHNLLETLVARGRADTPVDQLKFRCAVCGQLGTPWVTQPQEGVRPRTHLWPPGVWTAT